MSQSAVVRVSRFRIRNGVNVSRHYRAAVDCVVVVITAGEAVFVTELVIEPADTLPIVSRRRDVPMIVAVRCRHGRIPEEFLGGG